jgi:ABC-2 type transport system permease protein
MRGLSQLTWTEFKLNLRDPLMVFWSIAFPTLWLVFMAAIFKEPIPGYDYHGLNHASFLLPASIGQVIIYSSAVGVPLTLTTYRENAVFKRLRVTPVKTITLAASLTISQIVFVFMGVLILLLIGFTLFSAQILGSWLAFFGVLILGLITFMAIGSAIGSIAPSIRAANVIVWTLFVPMLLLSGMFFPLSMLPTWLQPITKFLPLTAFATLLRDIVFGVESHDLWRLGVLAAWMVLAYIVTAKFFRWE